MLFRCPSSVRLTKPAPLFVLRHGGQDEVHRSLACVRDAVVGRSFRIPAARDGELDPSENRLRVNINHRDGSGIQRLRSFDRPPQGHRGESQDGRFLSDRAGIREDADRTQLQLVVVQEPKWWMKANEVIDRQVGISVEPLASSRVG